MKKLLYLAAASMLVFNACNKDEEIIIDVPETPGGDTASPFTVLEYMPAPGQFINEPASGFRDIADMDAACRYAEERLEKNLFVSLGAWGGYITVASEKRIRNSGGYDFFIYGNAFDTSSEPGIVWVMQDSNGNGIPDEEWYELKGSSFSREGYGRNFSITYYRPEARGDVRWTDSDGNSGFIKWSGTYHSQDSYYPAWVSADSYTLRGSRLPDRSYLDAAGQWVNPPFEWGYADNAGKDSEMLPVGGMLLQRNPFRISDAVDASGNPVSLEYIDFIKVQTGICGASEVLGENSTEICGFSVN